VVELPRSISSTEARTLLIAPSTPARAQPLSSAGKSCGWWKPHVQLYAVKGFCQG
jgi:hypothetical protein